MTRMRPKLTGQCRYCGQIVVLNRFNGTRKHKNKKTREVCNLWGGRPITGTVHLVEQDVPKGAT